MKLIHVGRYWPNLYGKNVVVGLPNNLADEMLGKYCKPLFGNENWSVCETSTTKLKFQPRTSNYTYLPTQIIINW